VPVYEFQCGHCGRVVEEMFPTFRDVVLPSCQHGAALLPMTKIISRPRPHKLTGDGEFARMGRMISKRNVEYWGGKEGQEKIREDTSGHYDVTQIADQVR